MSFTFGDSFDLYATIADAGAGYWDSASGGLYTPGRFGGQAYPSQYGQSLVKSSGVNDPVHHITFAINPASGLQPTWNFPGFAFTFMDGTTAQCCVYTGGDGNLYLCSGGYGGTVLDSWTGAFPTQNQWFAFEIEVVINNTTGSWTIRKNGNTGTADHTLGSLNTRGGTANNYANKLQVGQNNPTGNNTGQVLDDLLWRSGDTSGTLPNGVPWVGDLRCFVRMPAKDQSVTWTPSQTAPYNIWPVTSTNTQGAPGTSTGFYHSFKAAYSGTIGSITVPVTTGAAGNIKCAIYNAVLSGTNWVPSTVIQSVSVATIVTTNPVTFTFTTPAAVTAGQTYFVALDCDNGTLQLAYNNTKPGAIANSYWINSDTFSAFPTANPIGLNSNPGQNWFYSVMFTPTSGTGINYAMVGEPQEDALATYVSDSTVGQADFYGIASISVTPASTVCVTTRAFAQKSDAGARSGAVQLKSGSTTVQSTPGSLLTTFAWNYRVDLVDPATSAAWTATGVNNAQIGPIVTA